MKLPPAILLTGATGLLGRFLLRRLLQAGHDVAVVVRTGASGGGASGASGGDRERETVLVHQRIEQVLQPFETSNLLPRPRAIAWDFAEPLQPGQEPRIAATDRQWLGSRNLTVIHCAASIRFQKDDFSGEPYRTNVAGTQNLLNLCQELTVSSFHHVSTAYVGQHRSGDTVMEVPVSSPERAGNDYERSKIQAEQLVMQCPHIGAKTIHRPSIVIGDSKTGFTSTFHGFYAPLQIGWQYTKMFGFFEQAGQWFRQHLGLNPNDRKNLVTVDWVAEGIVSVVEQQNEQSANESAIESARVLHWTNPEPIACQVMQSAILDSLERAISSVNRAVSPTAQQLADPPVKAEAQVLPSPEQFKEQMKVYDSYFQSDPTFDRQQVSKVSAHLVCPRVDYELLSKLSDWALQANFGWPKQGLPQLSNQRIVDAIQHFGWKEKPAVGRIVRVQLLGPGSPETLCFSVDENSCFQVSVDAKCEEIWRVSLGVVADCVSGTTDLTHTINNGSWLIVGKSAGVGLDCARNWINHIGKFLK